MEKYRYALCEVYTRKLLPSIKLYLAYRLVVDYKLSQLEVSRILGIKQPLVNYVVSGKRRPRYIDLLLSIPEIREGLDNILSMIAGSRSGVIEGSSLACTICDIIRRSGYLEKILVGLGYSLDKIYLPMEELGAGES
ncbi:MAG: hypothetical protein B6U89_07115 [Desulfurococcales archaeon ex4484_58]|nr:MAG: hypothetical protein B6U89_07115 [Desulfurococcales archaeon ex4484_58]